jgi:hypothetical protein
MAQPALIPSARRSRGFSFNFKLAGATLISNVTHLVIGDRVWRARNTLGNIWWFQTRVEDEGEEELARC